jgi:hypothetical protein
LSDIRTVFSREAPDEVVKGERRSERIRRRRYSAKRRGQENFGDIQNNVDDQTLDIQLNPSSSESETETSEIRTLTEENRRKTPRARMRYSQYDAVE